MKEPRGEWNSKLGFVLAAAGSAIGLANIWRFPYVTGVNGGAFFVFAYMFFLFIVAFPVFLAEIAIGKAGRSQPERALEKLSGSVFWKNFGRFTVLTGFFVSAFYSAVAGWILGYLFETVFHFLPTFTTPIEAKLHFESLVNSPYWSLICHAGFLFLSLGILVFGVKEGIERACKWMMPILFLILFFLVLFGLSLDGAKEGLSFLFLPNMQAFSWAALLTALGQAFFTLSLGQGTMITYGSYLKKKDPILPSAFAVILLDTFVSIMASVVIFCVVFSSKTTPDAGPSLLFQTLPWSLQSMPWGGVVLPLFFFLVLIAAITSEISAIEPAIAWLQDKWNFTRQKATYVVGVAVFLLGIPAALSPHMLFFGKEPLGLMELVASAIFIPVSALGAVIFAGRIWGSSRVIAELEVKGNRLLTRYLVFCFKYTSPALIIFVLLNAVKEFLFS